MSFFLTNILGDLLSGKASYNAGLNGPRAQAYKQRLDEDRANKLIDLVTANDSKVKNLGTANSLYDSAQQWNALNPASKDNKYLFQNPMDTAPQYGFGSSAQPGDAFGKLGIDTGIPASKALSQNNDAASAQPNVQDNLSIAQAVSKAKAAGYSKDDIMAHLHNKGIYDYDSYVW